MDPLDRLLATDKIKQAKASYFRGVDTADTELVRAILAEDCVLDYRGCFVDPASGHDFFPAMSVVLRGRQSWSSTALAKAKIVSVHQGHGCTIDFTSDTQAEVVWSMTDRLFFPEGEPHRQLIGYGYYRETYVSAGDAWLIAALRIQRLRVEAG